MQKRGDPAKNPADNEYTKGWRLTFRIPCCRHVSATTRD